MIIAFHKPYGILCQFTQDQPGQRTLAEFDFPKNVYPLGRLDMDSEGLLLLSDQPGINTCLMDPKNAHARTYFAQVEGVPSPDSLKKLCNGSIVIKKHRCLPCHAEILDPQPEFPPRNPPIRVRKNIPDTWISLELTEGKNRQVRRMTAAIGHPTLRLIRMKIANYSLSDLSAGQWKKLSPTEIQKLGL